MARLPVVRVKNTRSGLSGISTVANKGQMHWKAFDGALNSDIPIEFLRRRVRDPGRNVFLISGNLEVHRGEPVKASLAERKHEIEVF